MKSITPVISVILLIMLTIATSAAAFFFINSSVTDLEAQGNLESFPGADNSRLNLVSITGTKAIVRNDGTTPVTEVVMFVNGELLNYTLDTPIQPGELKEINFTAREAGEDLEIKVIYNNGKTAQAISPANKNTEDAGFFYAETVLRIQCLETYGNTWFTGSLLGSTGPCCGDNYYNDFFYNSSAACVHGIFITDADNLYNFDLSGKKSNCMSGKELCENKGFTYLGGLLDFDKKYNYSITMPYSVVLGDMNNDNYLDILIAEYSLNQFSYFKNNGNDSFETNVSYPTGTYPYSIAVGDMNNDGYLDVVTVDRISNQFSYFKNMGNGSFESKISYVTGTSPIHIIVSDLNNDGFLDVVTADRSSNQFSYFKNVGNGFFEDKRSFPTGSYPYYIAAGDIDNDGFIDIISADYMSKVFSYNRNLGNDSFNREVYYSTVNYISSVSLGDFDNDNFLDVITLQRTSNEFSFFKNLGNNTFGPKLNYSTGSNPYMLYSADLDNDGFLDVIIPEYSTGQFSFFKNLGNGSFALRQGFGSSLGYPAFLAAGDMDNDGDLDIITLDRGNGKFDYSKNNMITGINGPCCGDDINDGFYNNTIWCCQGNYLNCSDSNPCTTDYCSGPSCISTNKINGQYEGCIYSTGCIGDVCSCVSGECINTCGNGVCDLWENISSCSLDCDDLDNYEYNCNYWDHTWFNGNIENSMYQNNFDSNINGWSFIAQGGYPTGGWFNDSGNPNPGSLWFFGEIGGGYISAYTCFNASLINNTSIQISGMWRDFNTDNDFEQPLPSITIRKGCNLTGGIILDTRVVNCVNRCTYGSASGAEYTYSWSNSWHSFSHPTRIINYTLGNYEGPLTLVLTQGDWGMWDADPNFDSLNFFRNESSPCCGDDGILDTFYNGTISSADFFCFNGQVLNSSVDLNKTLCEYYLFDWIENSYGSNYSCCGDDLLLDSFTNGTYSCCNGILQQGSC
ncbi:MAG: VCBS repeat-containing protein [Candidatus Nanoarchaeia archaeon]|nr:VCBS repeat-containing protein [Candidatus Nanoarchaeia archaeon]